MVFKRDFDSGSTSRPLGLLAKCSDAPEEFLSLIDRLVEDVLPDAIFDYMGLQRHQIFWGVIMKVLTILTMFLFVFAPRKRPLAA